MPASIALILIVFLTRSIFPESDRQYPESNDLITDLNSPYYFGQDTISYLYFLFILFLFMENLLLILAKAGIALVAAEHLFILWMEMFAWETVGKRVFKGSLPDELFKPTKRLAANQGLYNGFLAAGLIWSLFICDDIWQKNIAVFFLSCVVTAGIYGALSASRKIFFTQALPAIIALLLVLFS